MKRTLFAIFILSATVLSLDAQPRKLLTMEDAILNQRLSPERVATRWAADSKGKTVYGIKRAADKEFAWFYAANGQPCAELITLSASPDPVFTTRENNIYYRGDEGEVAITSDTDSAIVNGQAVSRNEFGIDGGLFPSPDGNMLAFYRKDESRVTDFPLLDITTRTGSLKNIKYPMNGMDSEIVTLGIWNRSTGKTVWVDVTDFDEERYLTNITWSPDSKTIYIQVLDRAQKEMHLNAYDAATGAFVRTVCIDKDSRYVEPQYPLQFIGSDPDRFIYSTNVRDGYWNLYLYDLKKGTCRRLTDVDADVQYVGQDARSVYYYSAEVSPAEQHFCKVDLKSGKKVRLTSAEGWHYAMLSPDGKFFIDNYSSLKVPRMVEVVSTDARMRREIFRAADPTEGYNYTSIELGTIKSADGLYDNYYRLVYPLDFDPTQKYPVIVYVYGGPHTQLVNNSFCGGLRRWEMLMAQKGYAVFVMDNRGTPGHGAEYEKATHRHLGQCEMADQMKGVEWLESHPWVDADRIGVHGWSYGGFMTISLMTHYPDVFKVGVAGGPVIDWKWYEVMYGERYMETAATNPDGFAETSLIPQVANLKGKLLICQGAIDNTVVWEHSLSFVSECIKNNVQLDYFPYPLAEHNVMGKDRVHLMNKVTAYFDEYLK